MDQSLFVNEKEPVVVSDRVLYTASSFAKNSLMYLQEIGSLSARKEHTSKRKSLDSYLFFIVESGSGILKYDGVEYQLCAGDIVFIDCRRAYSHTTKNDDLWSLRWIHFDGPGMFPIYEKYIARGGKPVIHGVDESVINRLTGIHSDIAQTLVSEDYVKDMKINEGICSVLTLLMELSWNPTDENVSHQKKDILSVRTYINEHFTDKITLEFLADNFFINKYYLTRVFKEQYGVSINTYIQQLKITKAKQLLRFSDLPIEQIAADCGIEDSNYFSRMFKKVEGVSPIIYRHTWREKS